MLPIALLLLAPGAPDAPVVAVFEVQDTRVGEAKLSPAKVAGLTDYLRTLLAEGRAFKVVAGADLKRAMLDTKRASYQECYDEACQIEIGKAVSASKLVTTKVIGIGSKCIVTSTLFDLRTETTDRAEHQKGSCGEEALLATLEMVAVKLKSGRAFESLEEPAEVPPDRWDPTQKKRVIASFRSDPPGAVVLIDGELACQDTAKGCRRTLTVGRHRISMQKERYLPREEEVFVEEGTEVSWTLEPSFGRVAVRTEPPGIEIRIDGRDAGRTPLDPELEPGEHLFEVDDPCWLASRRSVTVVKGKSEQVALSASPREGAIDVSAVDPTGNAVRADVYVDGAKVGETPDVIKVSVCAERVRVESAEHGVWEGALSVPERQTVEVAAALEKKTDGEPTVTDEKEGPPPEVIGIRVGGQALLGLLCLETREVADESQCVDTMTGYGGLLKLAWPARADEGGWFFRGNVRAGFMYYGRASGGTTAYEIPGAVSGEVGLGGEGSEYSAGVEAVYAYRKITNLPPLAGTAAAEEVEQRQRLLDQAPHSVDLGVFASIRAYHMDVGAGIYFPVTGIGESIVARFWLGYAFDL